jgi:hypothetical protein
MSKVKAEANKSWHNRGSEKSDIIKDAATIKMLATTRMPAITKTAEAAGTSLVSSSNLQ